MSITGSSDGEDQSTAAVSTSPAAAAASSSYTDTKHSSVSTGGERLTSTASNNLTPRYVQQLRLSIQPSVYH